MNASVYSNRHGHYVKLYEGDMVVDDAGPFEDADDAELAAYRMTAPHGHVSRSIYTSGSFVPDGGDE